MNLSQKVKHVELRLGLVLSMFMLMLNTTSVNAQACDYVTGAITFNVSGGNNTEDYQTQYVLTDARGDILIISNTSTLDILNEGFYTLYSLNSRKGTAVSNLKVGQNIDNVTGDCLDFGPPFPFSVCNEIDKCNYCLGEEVILIPAGGNEDPAFKTQYVYTNENGQILEILDLPSVMMLDTGLFVFFAINYDTTKPILGLEIGAPIYNVESPCFDIGNPLVVVVCDQLTPTLFFDLRGCDITQTATLAVGGLYDTYEWSTGSTSDFIDISANTPAVYLVTVTLANGCIGYGRQEITGNEIASIGDFVWDDQNANGQQDTGEPGINGIEVNLYTDFDRNGQPDIPGFPSCRTVTKNNPTTGAPGYYNFNVYRSNYIVEFVVPSSLTPTTQNAIGDDNLDSDINSSGFTGSIGVLMGERRTDIDAGFRTSSTICGQVWNDENANGRRQDTEYGVNEIVVNLFNASGELIATTTTMAGDTITDDGKYCFEGVPVQQYYVQIELPAGQTLTEANASGDDTRDSEGTNANGPNTTDLFMTQAGQTTNYIDFGIYQGGSICGIVFRDEEGGTEAVYDQDIDSLLNNVLVQLLDAETEFIVRQLGTNSDGSYCITGIPIGSYKVLFPSVGGMSLVALNVGTNPLIDSDADPNTLMTRVFFVAPVDTIAGVNAGLRLGSVPVELTFFEGFWDRVKDYNVLNWQTASEINNEKFELQRAFGDNGTFSTIATLKGQGTTLRTTNYNYIDKAIEQSGSYYYRLKQIDYDGGFEYSHIEVIDVIRQKSGTSANLNTQDIIAYPNPADDFISIQLSSKGKLLVSAQLIDVTGKVVRSWPLSGKTNGNTEIGLSVSDIAPGIYTISLDLSDEALQQHVTIVR